MTEIFITRKDAANFLTKHGFPISHKTLAKYVVTGGGPEYQLFGRKPLYKPSALLEWGNGRLSAPKRTTKDTEKDQPSRQS